MSRLNIFTVSALIALTAIVSCDEQYDYYKIGKNNPTVRTLDVSEEQVGEDWADLSGSVRWEQSTSNHSFSCRFAISESPDFPAGETDTLYGETSGRKSIAQDDTTTHYYDATVRELKQGTTYYYAFSITDGIVEVSGQAQSFTTLGESSGTEGPRLVIPEPEYVADDIGGDPSVAFMIENYDIELYGELSDELFLVEHGDGGEDWIRDMGYYVDYPENQCVGSVFFIVEPNETEDVRSCSISVRLSIEGVVEQEEFIYVTQPSMSAEEPNLVMPEGTEFSVEAEGGDYDTFIPFIIENYSYEYYESHGEPELWIENGADWLSNVEYAYLEYGEDCTGYINLTASPNTTGSDRTGSFTFGFNDQSYDITISQPCSNYELDIPFGTHFIEDAFGGNYYVNYEITNPVDGNYTFDAVSNVDWITDVNVRYESMEGNTCIGRLRYRINPNPEPIEREGTITCTYFDQVLEVRFTQIMELDLFGTYSFTVEQRSVNDDDIVNTEECLITISAYDDPIGLIDYELELEGASLFGNGDNNLMYGSSSGKGVQIDIDDSPFFSDISFGEYTQVTYAEHSFDFERPDWNNPEDTYLINLEFTYDESGVVTFIETYFCNIYRANISDRVPIDGTYWVIPEGTVMHRVLD